MDMYSRRTSGRRTFTTDDNFSVLPPDYSGNAFGNFGIERQTENDPGLREITYTTDRRRIPDLTPSEKDCTGAKRTPDGNETAEENDGNGDGNGSGNRDTIGTEPETPAESEEGRIIEKKETPETYEADGNVVGAVRASAIPEGKPWRNLSDAGLEELLLLGVIFLIFSDEEKRDNELLISLLLIYFI